MVILTTFLRFKKISASKKNCTKNHVVRLPDYDDYELSNRSMKVTGCNKITEGLSCIKIHVHRDSSEMFHSREKFSWRMKETPCNR